MKKEIKINHKGFIDIKDSDIYADGGIYIFDNVKYINTSQSIVSPMNVILLCMNGSMQTSIGSRTVGIMQNEVLILPSNVILSECVWSDDFECKIVAFTDVVLQDCLHSNVSLWRNALYINKLNTIHVSSIELEYIFHLYQVLHFLVNDSSPVYQKDKIQAVVTVVLLSICSLMYNKTPSSETQSVQKEVIFQQFLQNLSASNQKRHPVAYYAQQLHITPKYLSCVCKMVSGKTCIEWIEEYVLEEIRYYLRNTQYSVKEVAVIMGFTNLSFFGRYVRRYTGMSPRQYQKKLREKDFIAEEH